MAHQLAQVNIGRLVDEFESDAIQGFRDGLEPINALAEASPGFVWRLQGEGGDATDLRPYDDPLVIVNVTVWTSIEALADFVLRSDHLTYLRRRREWFTPMAGPFACLWWVPEGHRPDPAEAKARLEDLDRLGPTPASFTFRHPFPAPDAPAA